MVSRVATVAFKGIEAVPVDVQVHMASGMVAFSIVGLGDKAVAESKERVRAALVLLCDQWQLLADDLDVVVNTWSANPQAAVVSAYNETSGPPAILPRAMFGRLAKLKGDRGASKALRYWKGEVVRVSRERAGFDIDTIEQLP